MALNVEVLEKSFALIEPKGEQFVQRFYDRLFMDYPQVKPMFANTSMAEQQKKLLASLKLVISNLRSPEKLTAALEDLGRRHVGYGVQPEHYDAVGQTLLLTLAEFAGAGWTPEVAGAWKEAYQAIRTIMLQGAGSASGSIARG